MVHLPARPPLPGNLSRFALADNALSRDLRFYASLTFVQDRLRLNRGFPQHLPSPVPSMRLVLSPVSSLSGTAGVFISCFYCAQRSPAVQSKGRVPFISVCSTSAESFTSALGPDGLRVKCRVPLGADGIRMYNRLWESGGINPSVTSLQRLAS